MAANHHSSGAETKQRRHIHEGPYKHIISFIMTIVLTAIAFAAVMMELERTFLLMLLVTMAVIQVIIQMFFWMHLKDKGHRLPIIAIASGCFVVIMTVIMSVYWLWW